MTSPSGNSDQQTPSDYFFADLAHLDTIIARWNDIQAEIRTHGVNLEHVAMVANAPAADRPSSLQARTFVDSMGIAARHNRTLLDHATAQVERLSAARAAYDETEAGNTIRLTGR